MELTDIHLAALALTAVVILYTDHVALGYFLGRRRLVSARFSHLSHALIWGGLFVLIVTGVLLVAPFWEYYRVLPAFYVKMGAVLVLLWNGYAIGRLARVASGTPFAELPRETRRVLLVSGALSALGWGIAASVGFLFL